MSALASYWYYQYALSLLYHPIRHWSHDDFHHGQVLQIVVGLEERIPREEFHQYTTDRKQVTWV
jgi:hypothetical protein